MTKLLFTPQDFATEHGDLLAREAADVANEKLRKWLSFARRIEVLHDSNPRPNVLIDGNDGLDSCVNFTALLVNIESLS